MAVNFLDRAIQPVQGCYDRLEKPFACRGQPDTPVATNKQINTQPFLDLRDCTADRTMRQVQFFGSAGKALMPCRGLKGR